MTTRIERLSPPITALAASIGQTVHYHGGDYFLLPCNRSLWNTREFGKLDGSGASIACRGLTRMVEKVKPEQAKPLAERVAAVGRLLREAGYRPGYFTEVTSAALDRGSVSQWLGKWTVQIHIAGAPDVCVRDRAGGREDAIREAERLALEGSPA